MGKPTYIGRFAPSPSGPLHLGSLMSATCSYLQAKSNNGQWLIRIEDVDTPRVVKGMADMQLKQLESFGFEWDSKVLFQSTRFNIYEDIVQQLIKDKKIYACECTRKHLKKTAETSAIGFIYPKTCLTKNLNLIGHSLRFKTSDKEISFDDRVFGHKSNSIQSLCSDWVIKRLDGIFSYHLAVVVDDAFQGITEVVRGLDILPLTPIHIELQNELGFKNLSYQHHPLIEHNAQKLSKQNHANPVNQQDILANLNLVLKALGQKEILTDNLDLFWQQAIKQWNQQLIPTQNYNV